MEGQKTKVGGLESRRLGPIVKEVILENFMSYEYARIPFHPGLNVICGPNGSGKSSILLGISVALGQAYTERSRRLSDLVRRGKDIARVSLLFDNKPVNGKRPIPISRSDMFMLSRYLRSDGSYWCEADFREVGKAEVVRMLKDIGINPDNMLIIMHQGMIEEFSVTSPQEKLKMVEEAVGFSSYREKVLEAKSRLLTLLSEETSLAELVSRAGQTLEYWKGIYDKYLIKMELIQKKKALEREHLWSHIIKHEKNLETLSSRLKGREQSLSNLDEKIGRFGGALEKIRDSLANERTNLRKLYFSLARLEKDWGRIEGHGNFATNAKKIFANLKENLIKLSGKIAGDPENLLKRSLGTLEDEVRGIELETGDLSRKGKDLEDEVKSVQAEIEKAEDKFSSSVEKYATTQSDLGVLSYRRKEVEKEVSEVKRAMEEVRLQLDSLRPDAEKAGERVDTPRMPQEVLDDLKVLGLKLENLGEVPQEAEKIYTDYASSYQELTQKLALVIENKEITLKEVESRAAVWRKAIDDLVSSVSPAYQEILKSVSGYGEIRVSNPEEIEEAGLELFVGFRGGQPVLLDSYTQSGGERSISVISFLLSLQRVLLSPIRAVDEFDVHMDPSNRETIFRMIYSYVKQAGYQCIVITPSQLTVVDRDAHIVTVQSVRGSSSVKEAR